MTIVIAETLDHHSLLRDLRTLYPSDHYFLSICILCLLCLSVNVKTAKPIGPKFSVGPRLLGRFLEHQNLKKKSWKEKSSNIRK